jgi:membrane protease YdiL (CAAX protease family)
MEKPEYQPNIPQAILLLLLYFFVFSMVPMLFFASLSKALGLKANDLMVNSGITVIGFILLLFWVHRRYRVDYQGLLALKQLKIEYILPMILMISGAVIVLSEIDNMVRTFLPLKGDWAKTFQNLFIPDRAGSWKYILAVVIVAPVVEEMIFRGLILKGFIKHYPAHRAIAFSALLFGVAHFNPWQFWTGILWGGIAGWWFHGTRSLVPCILGHALLNSSSYIITNILGVEVPGFTTDFQTSQFQPLWFDLLGIGLLVLGIIVFVKIFKYNKIKVAAD